MTKLSFVNLWLVSSKVTRWSWAKLHEHFFLSSFSKASTQVSMKDETLIRRGERFYQIQGLADLEFLILIHISVFHCVPLRSTRWSPDVAWARGWLWLPLHKLAAGNAVRRFPEFLAMSDVRSSSAWVSSVESATLMVSRLGNSVEQPSATERRTWSLPPSNLNVHNCAFQKKGWGGGEGKSAADEKRRMQEDLVYLGLPVQFFPDKIVGLCQVTYLARTVSPGALSSWRNQCPVSFLHILQPPSSTRDSWRGGGGICNEISGGYGDGKGWQCEGRIKNCQAASFSSESRPSPVYMDHAFPACVAKVKAKRSIMRSCSYRHHQRGQICLFPIIHRYVQGRPKGEWLKKVTVLIMPWKVSPRSRTRVELSKL